MKKLIDLKEGDLITLETAAKLLGGIPRKQLYEWRSKSRLEPDKYPRSAKIGGTIFFIKSDIIDRLNRQFEEAS